MAASLFLIPGATLLMVLSCPLAPTETVLLLLSSLDPPPIETEFLPVAVAFCSAQ